MTYLELIYKAGPVMWIIIAAFFLAMTFFLKKVMQFHRDEINVPELLRGLRNTLQRNAIVEALSLCDNTPGPIAKLLGAAILAYQNGGELRTAMDDVAVVEIPRLERHIHFIGTISFVMPLLGFLGTVIGMIEAFEATKISSGMFPELADAIGTALMTTAAGLTGAVICYTGHNYLVARLDMILLDMEKAAMEITSICEQQRNLPEMRNK
ncbi:MAG: MotA/TolQ/ExbB proton channel family protein [Lentisphaeria bacterium]|nr:MotA/TolQ/ExbB proton channel family protein [Lentisphaeria bacterium]